MEALIGFGWNLPITEHDGDHWSLECKENLDQIRMVLRDRPLRILDVLAARQEDTADWRAWRTMRGVDEMCVWYGALEHLGYQPSAEEREALKARWSKRSRNHEYEGIGVGHVRRARRNGQRVASPHPPRARRPRRHRRPWRVPIPEAPVRSHRTVAAPSSMDCTTWSHPD